MLLIPLPSLEDNYIWLLSDASRRCLIVDPGEAAPVICYLNEHTLHPEVILLTHHHSDHVGGVAELVKKYPHLRIYGPAEVTNGCVTDTVSEGDIVSELGLNFKVIHTPGHTLGHILYFSHPYLFCGDTLFSGGCGRLFEGTATQLYRSLEKISQLPDDTLICCAHEYTLSNMAFAHAIWPENKTIADFYEKTQIIRKDKRITLPSTLGCERLINVFLLTQDIELTGKIGMNPNATTPEQVLAVLRQRKDYYR